MDRHVDIHIRPDPEFQSTTLMNALFSKLHRVLAAHNSGRIGISFPRVDQGPALGTVLRLHGNETDIQSLMHRDWLKGMHDHIKVDAISTVPATAHHRRVRRVQVKSSPERLRRRLMRRHGISEAEARQRIPASVAQQTNLPYVTVDSGTTRQRFRLFIEHGPIQTNPSEGEFNSYGLSNQATIPWF